MVEENNVSYYSAIFVRCGVRCEPDQHNLEPPHVLQLLPPLCKVRLLHLFLFVCPFVQFVCLSIFVLLFSSSHVFGCFILLAVSFVALFIAESFNIPHQHKCLLIFSILKFILHHTKAQMFSIITIFSLQVFPAGLLQWGQQKNTCCG